MKFTAAALVIGAVSAADAAPAAATCTITKIEKFTDDACAKPDEAETKKVDAKALKAYGDTIKVDGKCVEVEKDKAYTKVICDGTGFGLKKYTDKECKTEDTAKGAQDGFGKWGVCYQKMKITDAKYISAGLVAVAAMVASQF